MPLPPLIQLLQFVQPVSLSFLGLLSATGAELLDFGLGLLYLPRQLLCRGSYPVDDLSLVLLGWSELTLCYQSFL